MKKLLAFVSLSLIFLVSAKVFANPVAGSYTAKCSQNETCEVLLDVLIFEGEQVALQIHQTDYDSRNYSPEILEQMVAILDQAYIEYEIITGRKPSTHLSHITENGDVLAPISIIPFDNMSCVGYACGYLGATGIELGSEWFYNDIYQPYNLNGEFATVLFYEMGRNYWFYFDILTGTRLDGREIGFTTGYAVFMRDVIADRLLLNVKANDAQTGVNIAQSYIEYMANSSRNWSNTFLAGDYPDGNTMSIDNNAFIASMFKTMHDELGDVFVERFWQSVEKQSSTLSIRNDRLIENLFKAASDSVSRNLYTEFTEVWKLPTPIGAQSYIPNEEVNVTNANFDGSWLYSEWLPLEGYSEYLQFVIAIDTTTGERFSFSQLNSGADDRGDYLYAYYRQSELCQEFGAGTFNLEVQIWPGTNGSYAGGLQVENPLTCADKLYITNASLSGDWYYHEWTEEPGYSTYSQFIIGENVVNGALKWVSRVSPGASDRGDFLYAYFHRNEICAAFGSGTFKLHSQIWPGTDSSKAVERHTESSITCD